MIAVCSACHAEYPLDATKVPASGGFFKCRRCGAKVAIPARDDATPAVPSIMGAPPPPVMVTDLGGNPQAEPDEAAAATAVAAADDELEALRTPRPTATPRAGASASTRGSALDLPAPVTTATPPGVSDLPAPVSAKASQPLDLPAPVSAKASQPLDLPGPVPSQPPPPTAARAAARPLDLPAPLAATPPAAANLPAPSSAKPRPPSPADPAGITDLPAPVSAKAPARGVAAAPIDPAAPAPPRPPPAKAPRLAPTGVTDLPAPVGPTDLAPSDLAPSDLPVPFTGAPAAARAAPAAAGAAKATAPAAPPAPARLPPKKPTDLPTPVPDGNSGPADLPTPDRGARPGTAAARRPPPTHATDLPTELIDDDTVDHVPDLPKPTGGAGRPAASPAAAPALELGDDFLDLGDPTDDAPPPAAKPAPRPAVPASPVARDSEVPVTPPSRPPAPSPLERAPAFAVGRPPAPVARGADELVSGDDELEPSAAALAAAAAGPEIMDRLIDGDVAPAAPASPASEPPADVSVPPDVAPPPSAPTGLAGLAARWTRLGRLRIPVASGAALVLVGLVVGVLGVAGIGPLARRAPPPPPPPKVVAAATPAPTGAPTPAPAPVKPPEPPKPPPPPPAPPLSDRTVDTMRWADLAPAARKLHDELAATPDPEREGLLLWTWYRQASLGDDDARRNLLARAPRPADAAPLGARGAAAVAGALLLEGKTTPARTFAEKLLKSRFKDSAALALVVSRSYGKPAELARAAKYAEMAVGFEAAAVDAQVLRARLALGKDATGQIAAELAGLAAHHDDPALGLEVTQALVAAGRFEAADRASAGWKLDDAARVPPPRRDAFLRLLVRSELRQGYIDRALAAAEAVRALLLAKDVTGATAALGVVGDDASPWIRYAQGLLAEHAGQASAAKAAYTAAAQGKPAPVEPQVALVQLGAAKPAAALAKLTALAKQPDGAAAEYQVARAQLRLGNAPAAAAAFERVMWTDPTVAPPAELFPAWLEALDKAGEAERALRIAEAMRAARPQDELPLHLVIDLAVRAGRTADVVAAREALLALAPDDVGRQIDLAGALTSAGKAVDAEHRLAALQKQKPGWKSPELLLELGRAWVDRDPVKARSLMRDSITLAARPRSYAVLGDLERKLGRFEEATDAFKKALELDPSLLEVRYGLIRLMIQRGQTGEATTELRRLIAVDPRDARAREMLGDTLLDLGDARGAAGAYQSAVENGGERAPVLMKLAKLQLQQLEQVGPAVKSLRRAIKLDPKLAEPHYYLGLTLKDQGKTPEARSELRAYLTLAPTGENADDAKRAIDDLERMP